MAAVEEGGLSIPEIARIFQVGVTFIKKMLKLHRAGEPLDPRHGGGPVPLLQEKETTLLRQELQARPDATLEELQTGPGGQCQVTVESRPRSPAAYRSCTCPGKKSLIASERDEKARKNFGNIASALDINKYVFIDEMGTNLGFTRRYGRAAPGTGSTIRCPGIEGATSRRSALSLWMASARA